MSRPTEYMFSKLVKEQALLDANYCCERCKIPKSECREGYLHVHHVLAVSMAIKYHPEIAPAIVSSLANTMVLCGECHKIMDEDAMDNHAHYAIALLSIANGGYTGGSSNK